MSQNIHWATLYKTLERYTVSLKKSRLLAVDNLYFMWLYRKLVNTQEVTYLVQLSWYLLRNLLRWYFSWVWKWFHSFEKRCCQWAEQFVLYGFIETILSLGSHNFCQIINQHENCSEHVSQWYPIWVKNMVL